jgi:N-methylhydantoinase B
MISSNAVVGRDDWFEMRLGGGGGYGDPLDRDPALVETDIRCGRHDDEAARRLYGVVPGDAAATERLRDDLRRARLARAEPAAKPLSRGGVVASDPPQPLFPGVVQRGAVLIAERSGALLAIAPDHWTDGCPCLIERIWGEDGPDILCRSWLDPGTGRALHVEATRAEDPDRFLVAPRRWTEAGRTEQIAAE